MQDIWNTIIVPVLILAACLGAILAILAIIKAFEWLAEKLSE